MLFKRKLHDGLYAVINRQGFKKIVFTNGKYETEDPEECKTLSDMGYDYEGDFPKEKKDKVCWNAWQDGNNVPVFGAKTKKEVEDWILKQDGWETMEAKKV